MLDEADTAGVKMNGDRRRPVTPNAVNTPAILFRANIPTFPRMLWLMHNIVILVVNMELIIVPKGIIIRIVDAR